MRIEALKYRTEDKQDIIIFVDVYDDINCFRWKIADIMYKTSRQKNYRNLSQIFRDTWEYRELNSEERRDYTMKKYEEFVGREKLEEAVDAAWRSIKPDMEKIRAK